MNKTQSTRNLSEAIARARRELQATRNPVSRKMQADRIYALTANLNRLLTAEGLTR